MSGRVLRSGVLGVALWILAVILALKWGSVPGAEFDIVMQLRLPRVILATAVGIGLAVAGAALQAVFANPLCEPYTLGISSGAALGAVLGLSLGLDLNISGLAGSAFVGGLIFAMVLYLISLRPGTTTVTLLLAGVMLGFLGSSLVALWMAVADPNGIQSAIFWLMGDLSRARLQGALSALGGALLLCSALLGQSRQLDAMLMGEEDALALGIDVRRSRRWLIVLSSLLVGLCVSGAGMIGFVGLVVPHFVRRAAGSMHRSLLPLCAIWGAVILVLSDLGVRVLARPFELPVGVVTALIGAPLFLWVLVRGRIRI